MREAVQRIITEIRPLNSNWKLELELIFFSFKSQELIQKSSSKVRRSDKYPENNIWNNTASLTRSTKVQHKKN